MWFLHNTTMCHASRTTAATIATFHVISLDDSIEHLNTGWHYWNNEMDSICGSRNVSTFIKSFLLKGFRPFR